MHIKYQSGHEKLAVVYVGQPANGHWIEFVESLQPPLQKVIPGGLESDPGLTVNADPENVTADGDRC